MEEGYYQLIALGIIAISGKIYCTYLDHKVKKFEEGFTNRVYNEYIPESKRLEARVKETFQNLSNKIEDIGNGRI